jgi:hypothetical protein
MCHTETALEMLVVEHLQVRALLPTLTSGNQVRVLPAPAEQFKLILIDRQSTLPVKKVKWTTLPCM